MPQLSRLEIVQALPGEYGQEIVILDWWRELLAAVLDPVKLMILLLMIRQSGKSTAMNHICGVGSLLTVPHAHIVFVAASADQAQTIFERKLRGPLTALLQRWSMPDFVRFTRRGAECPSLGSRYEITAPAEATITGRTPTDFIVDEAREIPDETFTALAPSVIGAGGRIVVGSSAGAPRGWWYEIVTENERNPTDEVKLIRGTSENLNPHADQKMLSFLRKQLAIVNPVAARRELENVFDEEGDSLLPWALVEEAIDDRLGELPSDPAEAFGMGDLSRRRDLTTRTIVAVRPPRRPEAKDHLEVVSMRIWDPKQSPSGEVDFSEVRDDFGSLPRRFPRLRRLLVDSGAESSSVLPWAKAHPLLSTRVEPFVASVTSNQDMWSALIARFHARTISIPRSERLLLELRNLKREEFAFGSRFRVVDSSRKYHRDLSLTLAGAVYACDSQLPDPGPSIALITADGHGSVSGPSPSAWREQYFRR